MVALVRRFSFRCYCSWIDADMARGWECRRSPWWVRAAWGVDGFFWWALWSVSGRVSSL